MNTSFFKHIGQGILFILFTFVPCGLCLPPATVFAAVTMQTGDETTLSVGDKDESQTSISSDEKGHSMRVVPPRQEDNADLPSSVIITPEIYWDYDKQQVRPPNRPYPPQKPILPPGKPNFTPGKPGFIPGKPGFTPGKPGFTPGSGVIRPPAPRPGASFDKPPRPSPGQVPPPRKPAPPKPPQPSGNSGPPSRQ